jgi:hypothetical protein
MARVVRDVVKHTRRRPRHIVLRIRGIRARTKGASYKALWLLMHNEGYEAAYTVGRVVPKAVFDRVSESRRRLQTAKPRSAPTRAAPVSHRRTAGRSQGRRSASRF